MPFLLAGSRRSIKSRSTTANFPVSPPHSECGSATLYSSSRADTPPVLDAYIFDAVPFSESFSTFLDFTIREDTFRSPTETVDSPETVKDAKRVSNRADASYYVEQLSNIKDVDSEWEDDDVEEVMIISPKLKSSPAPATDVLPSSSLPTPPFSPPVNPNMATHHHLATQESYTILRTLHRTQTSHLSLAVASGCVPSAKKSTLPHALYAIRTYRLPLSPSAVAERVALEVLSARDRGENPYVQRASRFWEDSQTLFIVLEHCGGGSLFNLIRVEGPVDITRMKRWACEITSGIEFIHDAGVVHTDIRPSTILLRVNGHVCISGFERAIIHGSRQSPEPSAGRRSSSFFSMLESCEAPEVLSGEEVGTEADCWAFGVVLVWMITGQQPWYVNAEARPEMIRDCILQGITPVLPLEKVDAVVESLINKCLDHDPDMRPTIKDIKASEWFADIDWNSIRREYGPDITITLPTPDMITDIPTDMPSTIIAPDLSLSVSEAETEGELSLPWTHPYLSALTLDTPSPGTSTLASGHSAVLSHADRGSFVAARRVSFTPVRPRNPSPPSLPSSAGGGDALARWSHRHQDESFLPRLSEADGATRIGLGVCVSEFGTFLPEHAIALAPASAEDDDGSDDDYDGSDSDTSSPDMTLQDALALPIPLLVTPRGGANTPDVRAGGTLRERIPARLLRWRSSGLRDSLTASHGVPNSALPEPTWHGLDADPFRSSPPPASAPPLSGLPDDADADAGEGMGMGGASPQRLDATFRWSTVSLDIGAAPQPRALQVRRAALATLSQRLRERGRALLRHSRSSMLLPRPRLPTPPRVLRADEGEKEELTLGRGVRRIGLGIGYSVSPPAPPAVPGYALREDAVPAGCYAGLGRRRKSVGQLRLQLQVRAAAGRGESASFLGRSEEGEGEEGVLVLGHPVSGAVALAASGSI